MLSAFNATSSTTIKCEVIKELIGSMENDGEAAEDSMNLLRNVHFGLSSGDQNLGSSDSLVSAVNRRSHCLSVSTQTENIRSSWSTPDPKAEIYSINDANAEDQRQAHSIEERNNLVLSPHGAPNDTANLAEEPSYAADSIQQSSMSRRGSIHHNIKSESRETAEDATAVPSHHRRSSVDSSRESRPSRRLSSAQTHQRPVIAMTEELDKLAAENSSLRRQLMDAEMNLKVMNVRSAREAARAAKQSLGARRKSIDSSAALQNQFAFDEQRKHLMERKQSLKSFRADILEKLAGSGEDEPGSNLPRAKPRSSATTPPMSSPSLRASRRMSTGEIPVELTVSPSKDESESTEEPDAPDREDSAAMAAVRTLKAGLKRSSAEVKRLGAENHRLKEEIDRFRAD